ncbi:MAG TPA: COX15/CtaA family protein [Steroidobacteraceae bacterium]|nr:COX15/CtaA family protein [Steroidobacteraceae bacterium]
MSNPDHMREVVWIRRLALAGALLCFGVVVLGGYTRLSNSGLGCPDWPGCFGHIAPPGSAEHYASAADVRKAWVEMIHRYFAGTLGLIIVAITVLSIRARTARGVNVLFAFTLLVLVMLQGFLGMLTVTWLLKPAIVTAHLLGGLTTFALLLWLYLSMRAQARAVDGATVLAGNRLAEFGGPARGLAGLALAALALQVFLGGWTSSNYAALACPDVPRCQNQWIPAADYHDAFVLWRGLGINYAGGVLDHPARVAIHFMHRVGALTATILLLFAALFALRGLGAGPRWAALAVIGALALQVSIGVFMVLRAFPLDLAAAHNAGAALLVGATVLLNRRLRPVADFN